MKNKQVKTNLHFCKSNLNSFVEQCTIHIFGHLQNQFLSNIALQLSKHGKLFSFFDHIGQIQTPSGLRLPVTQRSGSPAALVSSLGPVMALDLPILSAHL